MAQDPSRRDAATTKEHQRNAYLEGEWGNPLTTTRIGGRILNAFQVPLFKVLPPRGYAVLTTTGRKTGKPRHNCVRAIRDGDKVYLVSLPGRFGGWFRNIQAHSQVKLRLRGGTFDGVARELGDGDEYETARTIYCGTLTPFDRATYLVHRTGRPTPETIRELLQRWFAVCTPLVVELCGEKKRS